MRKEELRERVAPLAVITVPYVAGWESSQEERRAVVTGSDEVLEPSGADGPRLCRKDAVAPTRPH